MSKKLITILIIIAAFILGGWYLFKKEVGTVTIPEKNDPIVNGGNNSLSTVPYLKVPEGFGISIYAKDLPGARTILVMGNGILVAQTSEGKVTLVSDTDNDGIAETKKVILDKLNKPHGLAEWGEGGQNYLYVAEKDKLTRYNFDDGKAYNAKKLIDLPSYSTDRHFTRSLIWAPSNEPDGYSNTLLISVGSSCNVCNEKDQRQGAILSYNIVTNKLETYATGLRNAVFMTRSFVDGKIWATEMGRDSLGDNIPPDEINIIEKGKNYGWPICYGKNIHDTDFDKNTYIRNPCMEPMETESHIDLQAHSAPLGLSFIPEEGWPEDHWYNLLVSYHGSWNRSEPTGYKIARIKLDSKGKYLGIEEAIVLPNSQQPYISDDNAGVIYKLYRTKE